MIGGACRALLSTGISSSLSSSLFSSIDDRGDEQTDGEDNLSLRSVPLSIPESSGLSDFLLMKGHFRGDSVASSPDEAPSERS